MRKKVSSSDLKEIDDLFAKASSELNSDKQIKLVKKARKLAKKSNTILPKRWRDKFCHKCNSWFNAKNIKIRIKNSKISKKCLNCEKVSRKKFRIS